MPTAITRWVTVFTLLLCCCFAGAGLAQSSGEPGDEIIGTRVIQEPPVVQDEEFEPVKILLDEIAILREQMFRLRQELADARMQAAEAQRELEEMRRFIADHRQYGNDFEQYRSVKEIAERDARRKEAEEGRQRREQEKLERQARLAEARAIKAQRDAESSRLSRYRRDGFTPVGLDVYAGKMAFYYSTTDHGSQVRVDYDWRIGRYLRPFDTGQTIDYSQMTISGSVLNGDEVTRNIGVAITFFDDNGNQVGHEIVRVNNARPDVPYPFTSKINMALNREFDSSSIYVLYADPIDDADAEAPASTNTSGASGTASPSDQPTDGDRR
jgi:hypothetical protein